MILLLVVTVVVGLRTDILSTQQNLINYRFIKKCYKSCITMIKNCLLIVIIVITISQLSIVQYVGAKVPSTSASSSSSIAPTFAPTGKEKVIYILVFSDRTIGFVDNKTRYVPSVISTNPESIRSELLEELNAFKFVQPSEQLKQQVNTIITNGIKGSPCDVTIPASTGNKEVHCTTTGDRVVWYVYGIP